MQWCPFVTGEPQDWINVFNTNFRRAWVYLFIFLILKRWGELSEYLHYKLLKTLLNIYSSFCTAFSIKASILSCKVHRFLFGNNPFTFLKHDMSKLLTESVNQNLIHSRRVKQYTCKFINGVPCQLCSLQASWCNLDLLSIGQFL